MMLCIINTAVCPIRPRIAHLRDMAPLKSVEIRTNNRERQERKIRLTVVESGQLYDLTGTRIEYYIHAGPDKPQENGTRSRLKLIWMANTMYMYIT